MAPHKRRQENTKFNKHPDSKRRPNQGRQELRQVTRTARREKPNIEQDIYSGGSSSGESEHDEAAPKEKFQDGKAYDALLTLLRSEHPSKISSGHKATPSRTSQVAGNADSEEDEEIAGLNLNEPSDDETEINVQDNEASDDNSSDEDTSTEDVHPSGDKNLFGVKRNAKLSRDPFENHFNLVDNDVLSQTVSLVEGKKWTTTSTAQIHSSYNVSTQVPPTENLNKCILEELSSFSGYHTIKQRIQSEYLKVYPDSLSTLDASLLHNMLEYKDVNYPYQNYKNSSYRKLYLTHVLNHTFKTRDRILKNNDKIKSYHDALKSGTLKKGVQEPELHDQGFTRPKTLILLPTRNSAYEVVEQIIKLSGSTQQENRRKFKSQFYQEGGPPETKPADFRQMFKGNSNDFFTLGIKFTRKSVKLYASFFSSDILIASPIGLSMILEDPKQSKRQYDFLSSIEILVIDQANQIEMQNWDHISTVLKYVNKIPKDFHGADFSRVRMWAINDQSKFLRQTLVFSEFLTPCVNSVVSRSCNLAGKVRYKPIVTTKTCIMNSVGLKIKQIFHRFECADPQMAFEARFKFFANSVLPSVTKQSSYEDGLLIYIPSYFDYVRIKAYMKNNTKLDFASIDEYSSQSKTSRARHNFGQGRAKILLYTERMHHFRRFELAGVKNVLIYEAPSNPLFYKELLKFVGKSIYNGIADMDLSFVKTIYSKWDAAALERIVGNERAPILCNSVNELYEFR